MFDKLPGWVVVFSMQFEWVTAVTEGRDNKKKRGLRGIEEREASKRGNKNKADSRLDS